MRGHYFLPVQRRHTGRRIVHGRRKQGHEVLEPYQYKPERHFPRRGTWVTGNDRRGPWIEGCSWEALPDDGPNITGNCYLIEKVIAPNRFQVKTGPAYQNPIWQTGDEIVFWNSNTGLPIVETTVVATEEQRDKSIIVTMRDPVDEVVPVSDRKNADCRSGTHLYNLSCQNPQTVIRNNRIKGGRRFGFNLKTTSALIEGNHFEDLASSALYFENEPSGWEGLVNRNIVVQDNVITGCGEDMDSLRRPRANIHVNLWHNPPMTETAWRGHCNIVIRRNTITNREGIAIGIDNAADVVISDNIISNQKLTPPMVNGPLLNAAIRIFPNVDRIHVTNNRITAKEPSQAAVLNETNPSSGLKQK